MAWAIQGTPIASLVSGVGNPAVYTVSLPDNIQPGELICVMFCINASVGLTAAPGTWGSMTGNRIASGGIAGMFYKVVDGTEGWGASGNEMTLTQSGGSGNIFAACRCRISGFNASDPTHSDNWSGVVSNGGGAVTSFSVPADTLTGITSGNGVLFAVIANAARAFSSVDADLTTLAESNSAGATISAAYDADCGGTGNPQYDITMNSSRDYDYMLFEVAAAGGGAGGGAGINVSALVQNYRNMGLM